MTQNNKKEEVRQKIEKIFWKHYNDGGYAMNGEEASNEMLTLFEETLERERESIRKEVDKKEITRTNIDDDEENHRNMGYNKALSDVLNLLKPHHE